MLLAAEPLPMPIHGATPPMIFGSLASQELLKAVKSIGTIWVSAIRRPLQYPGNDL